MASTSLNSSQLDLQPPPLRIVKDREAYASGSSTDESSESEGEAFFQAGRSNSPLPSPNRPLMVPKVRNNGSFPSRAQHNIGESDNWRTNISSFDDDPDRTPRAPHLPRMTSNDTSISSDFSLAYDEADTTHYSEDDASFGSFQENSEDRRFSAVVFNEHEDGESDKQNEIQTSRRRFSVSGGFMRAFVGPRSSGDSKRLQKSSKKSPAGAEISSSQKCEKPGPHRSLFTKVSHKIRRSSIVGYSAATHIDYPAAKNTSQVSIPHRNMSPMKVGYPYSQLPVDSCVFSPIISIISEFTRFPIEDDGFMWVAVHITGKLHNACGSVSNEIGGRKEPTNYGYLYDVAVQTILKENCLIVDQVGTLDTSSRMCINDSRFALFKIHLTSMAIGSPNSTESAEHLHHLERHLGASVTTYLTIRMSYRHSGFPCKTFDPPISMAPTSTFMFTEADGVISRYSSEDEDCAFANYNRTHPVEMISLAELAEMYMSRALARVAVRKLAEDRAPIPPAIRTTQHDGKNSANIGRHIAAAPGSVRRTASNNSALDNKENVDTQSPDTKGLLSRRISCQERYSFSTNSRQSVDEESEDDDLARSIWHKMRDSSRGTHTRRLSSAVSVTTREPTSFQSLGLDSKSELSGSEAASRMSISELVDNRRSRILEVALRNKRSVGTETLRSMAPSDGEGGSPILDDRNYDTDDFHIKHATGVRLSLGVGLGVGLRALQSESTPAFMRGPSGPPPSWPLPPTPPRPAGALRSAATYALARATPPIGGPSQGPTPPPPIAAPARLAVPSPAGAPARVAALSPVAVPARVTAPAPVATAPPRAPMMIPLITVTPPPGRPGPASVATLNSGFSTTNRIIDWMPIWW